MTSWLKGTDRNYKNCSSSATQKYFTNEGHNNMKNANTNVTDDLWLKHKSITAEIRNHDWHITNTFMTHHKRGYPSNSFCARQNRTKVVFQYNKLCPQLIKPWTNESSFDHSYETSCLLIRTVHTRLHGRVYEFGSRLTYPVISLV